MAGSQLSARLARRVSPHRVLVAGLTICVAAAGLLLVAAVARLGLAAFQAPLALAIGSLGLVIPYLQLASEPDRRRALEAIRAHASAGVLIFVGVTDPISPRVETPEEVRDRVLEAAQVPGVERLGTTDDCGFSPFADDTSTSRDIAFEKIRARVEGTKLAAEKLGV